MQQWNQPMCYFLFLVLVEKPQKAPFLSDSFSVCSMRQLFLQGPNLRSRLVHQTRATSNSSSLLSTSQSAVSVQPVTRMYAVTIRIPIWYWLTLMRQTAMKEGVNKVFLWFSLLMDSFTIDIFEDVDGCMWKADRQNCFVNDIISVLTIDYLAEMNDWSKWFFKWF